MKNFRNTSVITLLSLMTSLAHAQSTNAFNYDGRLMQNDGTPIQESSVQFKIAVMSPGPSSCMLYEEIHTLNMANSNGYYSIRVGDSTATRSDSYGFALASVFRNTSPFAVSPSDCASGSGYTPSPADGRYLRVAVKPASAGSFDVLPILALSSAPTAFVAESLQGKLPSDFLKLGAGQLTQVNAETVFSATNYPKLVDVLNRNPAGGAQALPVIAGNATGAVAGSVWFDSSTNQLKFFDGVSPVVVGSGSGGSGGVSAINGLTAANQTFAVGTGGSSASWSSAGSTHTLNIPMASSAGVAAGLISTTQFDSFNAKLNSALASGKIFVGNASNVATAVTPTGDVAVSSSGAMTLTSIRGEAVAAGTPLDGHIYRWNSSTKWTPSYLSMADIRSTVTPTTTIFPTTSCTPAQTLTWSSLTDTFVCAAIQLSGTQVNYGSAVTAGFVFAGPSTGGSGAPTFRALALSDIPASVASKWALNGGDINYMNGRVGVGTFSPQSALDVYGDNSSNSALIVPRGSMGARPTTPVNGMIRYNTTTNTLETYTNFSWVSIATGASNPWTVSGPDLGYTAGNVGIGTNVPSAKFEVLSTTSNVGNFAFYASNSAGSVLNLSHARGAVGAPSAIQSGDRLGAIYFRGYGSTMFTSSAYIHSLANENFTDTASGADLRFATTTASTSNAVDRMIITGTGNVGIGTIAPAYKLDVVGDINATGSVRSAGVVLSSDLRFKKNIETIQGSLAKILNLRGVRYDWRRGEFPQKHFNDRKQIGVIAQEVELEFPEAVETGADGYKSVNYPALVSPLIEATRELNSKIESLEAENASLKAKLNQQERDLATIKARLGL